ncbi:OLC1v1024224C1 [Oldenlandia corymbosa var. corymbosa]|uniref:OLC1v1024224C1 n=1 Tax=Oldenlandia corymbosa var. corymbosa TaxID=529605 RepID=A0AAV1C4M9_OLDCO|nr:OLC1v1024224C1 [Oldenlandia corymbosa var. corymbosa]
MVSFSAQIVDSNMVVSSVVTSTDSALRDIEMRVHRNPPLRNELMKHKIRLRNLKAFVLVVVCATQLGKEEDTHLESLLLRIEDAVKRYAKEIHRPCDASSAVVLLPRIRIIFSKILCLEEEIHEWYVTLSKNRLKSSSLTPDEMVKITDSILGNLIDFPTIPRCQIIFPAMEALVAQMTFLKNFILFSVENYVECSRNMNDLFAHFGSIATEAAGLFFGCPDDDFDDEWCQDFQFKCSLLLNKVKPVDPQVSKIYAIALSSLKSCGHVCSDTQACLNFLDSLISELWDLLRQGAGYLDSVKDERQILYEGLRFLRTNLKQQIREFYKVEDPIVALICDAGVLICSFHHTHEEIQQELRNFLESIRVTQSGTEEKHPQPAMFNFPCSTNELDFVDSLSETLMQLTKGTCDPSAKTRAQTIGVELSYLRAFLEQTKESRHENQELQALWSRVLEVAYRVEFLIDQLKAGDTSYCFSVLSDCIVEEIADIKTALSNSSYGNKKDTKVEKVNRSQVPSVPHQDVVVGFHDDAREIVNRLNSATKNLQVVSICGMAGAGKTCLASKVYNDVAVIYRFHYRAWCSVPPQVYKRGLLIDILNQLKARFDVDLCEDYLAEKLRRHLKMRKYLIVLDGVWNIGTWYCLANSFPDDYIGSRILVTSQQRHVVPPEMLHNYEPYSLSPLSAEESFVLLQRRMGKDWSPDLRELGIKIAENCNGLPFIIVNVADDLAKTEEESWKEILDDLSSGIHASAKISMNLLELSYNHLPDHLKACFLYFGAFPKGEEVSVKRLILLWRAEGFVQSTRGKRLVDVAEEYLNELIGRSLVVVAKKRSIGGVKTCWIHYLVHDFCLRKVEEANFFHLLQGYDNLSDCNEPSYLRRLCIYGDGDDFKESKLFCPRARSLLLFPSQKKLDQYWMATAFVISIFKLLKVLNLEHIHLGGVVPSEIGLLLQLTYLSIRGSMEVIPSWIGNLSNLETFIVNLVRIQLKVSLPPTFWNLKCLRLVSINSGGGILPIQNLENPLVLSELESFSGAVISCSASMENQMRKFPSIRRLKCDISSLVAKNHNLDVVAVPLAKLESLHILRSDLAMMNRVVFDLDLPVNLKKLTLSRLALPWEKILPVGTLPKLEVLKLLDSSFVGDAWDMEEYGFPSLRFLKMSRLDIVRWTVDDDEFGCLQNLVLDHCSNLVKLPSCLECISTLEMIDVFACSDNLESELRRIEEEQVKVYGNDIVRIHIR